MGEYGAFMWMIVTGCLAFILFIIYDINQITGNKAMFRGFFLIGFLIIVSCTIGLTFTARNEWVIALPVRVACGLSAPLFLALMVYSLFFALPFKQTYLHGTKKREAYDRGVYAFCRHPGVLWFLLFYMAYATAAASGTLLIAGICFSALNILYALLQDYIFFPRIFLNYALYRRKVPFLVPTHASVRLFLTTIKTYEENHRT